MMMKNPVLDLIHAHGSVRRYKPDLVPASVVEAIVAAAQRASTSSNMQTWSVVAVTAKETRSQLAELCGGQKHIVQAPVFLAWCADRYRIEQLNLMRGYQHNAEYLENFLVATVDAAIAAQNAALAAESLGLGICYIGGIRNNSASVIDLLGLPKHLFPIAGMTLGYPENLAPVRPRLPQDAILHWERYNPEQGDALHAYDQTMIETGIYKGRQVDVPGKEGEKMEEYGWLEHTARRTSQPSRTELLSVVKAQGFGMK